MHTACHLKARFVNVSLFNMNASKGMKKMVTRQENVGHASVYVLNRLVSSMMHVALGVQSNSLKRLL
jgi:hypothetical protein